MERLERLQELIQTAGVPADAIEGISFSGQMHGLVLLDGAGNPVRNAILWNDTRTTAECREIEQTLGKRASDDYAQSGAGRLHASEDLMGARA